MNTPNSNDEVEDASDGVDAWILEKGRAFSKFNADVTDLEQKVTGGRKILAPDSTEFAMSLARAQSSWDVLDKKLRDIIVSVANHKAHAYSSASIREEATREYLRSIESKRAAAEKAFESSVKAELKETWEMANRFQDNKGTHESIKAAIEGFKTRARIRQDELVKDLHSISQTHLGINERARRTQAIQAGILALNAPPNWAEFEGLSMRLTRMERSLSPFLKGGFGPFETARLGFERLLSQFDHQRAVLLDAGGGPTTEEGPALSFRDARLRVDRPPRVRIFELCPPPVFDNFQSIDEWQQFALARLGAFKYRKPATLTNECGAGTPAMNLWQKFAYHYHHPHQEHVSGVLFSASAGIGKSWAFAAIQSVWGRAGFALIAVTKLQLVPELLRAMFTSLADVNVNNAVNGFGLKPVDVSEAEISPDAQGSAREKQGKGRLPGYQALRDMGVQCVRTASGNDVFSYEQFDNLMRSEEPPTLRGRNPAPPPGRPFWRTFISIYEVHLFVAPPPGSDRSQQVDYVNIRERLFAARAGVPKSDWPVLAVYTATPTVAHPYDIIQILNLLVQKEDAWLDFLKDCESLDPSSGRWTQDHAKMTHNFLDMYVQEDGSLNRAGLRKWNRLAAGRVSAVDAYGDANRFAQVKLQPLKEVRLSEFQTKAMMQCIRDDTGGPAGQEAPKTKGRGKKALEEDLEIEARVLAASPAVEDCFLRNAVGVNSQKKTEDKRALVPNVYATVDEIVRQIQKSNQERNSEIVRLARIGQSVYQEPVTSPKILLYVASANQYAYKRTFEALQEAGFLPVNRCRDGTCEMLTGVPAGKGYIDFTSKSAPRSTRNVPKGFRTWGDFLINYFCDPKTNLDGSKAMIFVLSSFYREGISLSDVKKIFIQGMELTDSHLIQAISRAVRFCKSTGLRWDPQEGYGVEVFIQRLMWGPGVDSNLLKGRGVSVDLNKTFMDVLRKLNPEGEKLHLSMDFMTNLTFKDSVDMLLFNEMRKKRDIKVPL